MFTNLGDSIYKDVGGGGGGVISGSGMSTIEKSLV